MFSSWIHFIKPQLWFHHKWMPGEMITGPTNDIRESIKFGTGSTQMVAEAPLVQSVS